MNPYTFFWKSSIGKKWLVALTGLVLVGYLVGHLVGNLQIFLAPEKINAYAAFLHSMPGMLWVVRAFLILCLVLHVVTTIKLVKENRAARPDRYAVVKRVQSTWASRTMILSGLIVLAFIVFHILHFTTRSIDPQLHPRVVSDPRLSSVVDEKAQLPAGAPNSPVPTAPAVAATPAPGAPAAPVTAKEGEGIAGGVLKNEYDVHTMIISGFWHHPWITAFYVLSLFLLFLHLSHGLSSLAQTFGLNSKKTMHPLSVGGRILAWAMFAGYAFIPLAVWFQILKTAP